MEETIALFKKLRKIKIRMKKEEKVLHRILNRIYFTTSLNQDYIVLSNAGIEIES